MGVMVMDPQTIGHVVYPSIQFEFYWLDSDFSIVRCRPPKGRSCSKEG